MENFEQSKSRHESPEKEVSVEVEKSKESALVSFQDLELSAENPTSPEIRIVVEKQPIDLIEGKSYGNFSVLIDKETEQMRDVATEAEALRELPEEERPAKLLEILRSKVHYAYNEVVEKLSETDPDLAQWVAENTGLNRSASSIPLSQIIEKGYGVCGHLSTAYLWLAQKAGLKGVVLNSDHRTIKNIERSDTKEKLFKSAEIGQPVSAHSWVEIKTSDGRWIPVDPSTKLVGDTEEGLEMFRSANYMASGNLGLDIEAEPRDKLSPKGSPILFAPAESSASGVWSLELKSTKPTIRIGKENLPPTNIPYTGNGSLHIKRDESSGGPLLDMVSVEKV